ncbi:MAG: biphenyl 2,3-dioxygenase [Actinobacteria bacterium]|nr:MAG: biphenyl 2,3-dioxygenase [Actinomycetota bacterium]
MTKSAIRIALCVALVAAAAIVPAQAASGGAVAARSRSVILKHIAFHPRTAHIRVGGTVTWRWRDGSIVHNVVGSGFRSPTKAMGTYTLRFRARGTYNYVCTIHPGMTGKVIVG